MVRKQNKMLKRKYQLIYRFPLSVSKKSKQTSAYISSLKSVENISFFVSAKKDAELIFAMV